MNIKDFLMDNYIYIIIVIILIIVTIIGFLADKQRGGKKNKTVEDKEAPATNGVNNPTVMEPISYQPTSNTPSINTTINPGTLPINNSVVPTNQPMAMNNTMAQVPNMNTAMNNPINNIGAPQPVEPMNSMTPPAPEPMYQPLSEQKPNIAPVPPIQNMNNNFNQPPTFETVGIQSQPVPEVVNQPLNMTPDTSNSINNIAQNNVQMGANPIPPVTPQPIPNPTESTIPNPITPPEPATPQPVGFVFGPQQNPNNNQPM